MTDKVDTSVDGDIVSRVAADVDVKEERLFKGLTAEGGPSDETVEAVAQCYELQSLRNNVEPDIKEAAKSGSIYLVDSDGYVFWVDQYDGFGAYIHAGDGDTYYVSLSQLQGFTFSQD